MNFNGRSLVKLFSILYNLGVRDFVVSPGSRSTPLALCAHELHLQTKDAPQEKRARCFVGIDERASAFFALGRARGRGKPACLICTSGTAPAHYLPAILEARHSRVPLIILSADRPPQAYNMGAPQTTDQLKLFASAVDAFFQAPTCNATNYAQGTDLEYASQLALDVCAAATGTIAAPVHVNFPFEDDLRLDEVFLQNCMAESLKDLACSSREIIAANTSLDKHEIRKVCDILQRHRAALVVGPLQGSNEQLEEILNFAVKYELPLLADPFSQLRSWNHLYCISSYDSLIKQGDVRGFDLIIRFGSFPVSKALWSAPINNELVVDAGQARDFRCKTRKFVCMDPFDFVRVLNAWEYVPTYEQVQYRQSLCTLDKDFWHGNSRQQSEKGSLAQIMRNQELSETSCIHDIIELLPHESLLFCGNSMSIRHLDSCYKAENKRLHCMAHRGLNGIDGTLGAALGASFSFKHTTCVLGDISFLHDVSSLAFVQELMRPEFEFKERSCVIVVLNNGGGAIFGNLFQREYARHFERLFVCKQDVQIPLLAQAYGASYTSAKSDQRDFRAAYEELIATPGIHLLEVCLAKE